ncbi:Phox domain-containing protein [Tieghemostelium lacteum]|uniref:Phox domain-containing protein n=1 Tax=Tieghemostelium lacteum TaxID=361077 RepID=A0A151ZID3_TIELA|nr:Phox domain-containing protein [Tieghemostelium lacteum]|eukprot:KYQ93640.1 Phox domain-containing protein [Tieghemostelium lacteum]
MSTGYNSDLLFGTTISYGDSDSTFESFSNEPLDTTNPFNNPIQPTQQPVRQEPVVVVQQKINPPSPHNSVTYSSPPVQQQQQQQQQPIQQQQQQQQQPVQSYPTLNSNTSSTFVSRESLKTTSVNPQQQQQGVRKTNTMEIEVKDPETIGDGMSAYVIYKVYTKSFLPDHPDYKKESNVTRRYSDFLWLRNVLKETRRGTIIPPIPEKAVINNRNKEFLETRRRELEKFLNRVVENEALIHSNELKIFLEGKDEQLADIKRSRPDTSMESSTMSPPQREEKGLNKITSLFSSGITSINNLASSVKEVDGWFGDKKAYVLQLDSNLRKLEETVGNIIRKRRELASAIGEFVSAGLSFSSCEAPHKQDVAHGFQKLTEVESNIKKGMEELCNNETGYFEEGIRDYIKVLGAVKELLNDRLDALFYMQNQERILASKKEKLEKLRMSNPAKASAMSKEVEDQTRKLSEAKSEYERITASAKLELNKFDEKRASEMKRILNFVIRLNLDHFLKSSDCWKEFLTEQHQNGDPNFSEVHNKASWGSTTI